VGWGDRLEGLQRNEDGGERQTVEKYTEHLEQGNAIHPSIFIYS
jgi:hypothetical protein